MESTSTSKEDEYVYVLIENFPRLLRSGATLEKLANSTFSKKPDCYQDFRSAANTLSKTYSKPGRVLITRGKHHKTNHTGIAKIKLSKKHGRAEITKEEFIKGLESITHTSGVIITRDELDTLKHEQQEEKQIKYNKDVEEERYKTQSILKDITTIPSKLRYLLFVDFELFHRYKENWIDYEFREPGCIKNLFETLKTILELYLSNEKNEKQMDMTLEQINDLHLKLSQKLTQMNTRTGYRTNYNGFPITKDTSTLEGVEELLFRIRKDNNADGFMLGSPSNTEYEDKEKFQDVIKNARQNALACAGNTYSGAGVNIKNFSDQQIKELAKNIYEKLQKDEIIYILPPEPKLAYQYALNAVKNYNEEIKQAITINEKIKAIDKLTHELEILHLYYDVNLRTNYLLTNLLLISNGIKWTILYDPNRIDLYSEEQRIEEIKKGIFRFEHLMKNKEEILEEYNKLNDGLAQEFSIGNLGLYKPFERDDKLIEVQRKTINSSDPEGDTKREMLDFDKIFKEQQKLTDKVIDDWSKEYDKAEASLSNFLKPYK